MTKPFLWWPVQPGLVRHEQLRHWRGLVGAWPAIGRGNVIPDVSGQQNPGVITGGSWVGGRDGYVLSLDGASDLVTMTRIPDLANWTAHITYTPDDVSGTKPILDQGDILIYQQDDDLIFGATDSLYVDYTATISACFAARLPVDIIVTRSGTTITAYILDHTGGYWTGSFTVSGTALTALTNLIIGANSRTAFVFPALTPSALTGENGLLITASDDVQYPVGSLSLNSDVVAELWNGNQMTFGMWVRLNFVPGDGVAHYLLSNKPVGGNNNRTTVVISAAGSLNFNQWDKDGTFHQLAYSITGWDAGKWHQIVARIDFKNDEIELYTDGISRDSTPSTALSGDSIDAINNTTNVGKNDSTISQLNGVMTIQIFNRSWSDAEIAADYAAGAGVPFVCGHDTLLLGDYSNDNTGALYWHRGQKISSISTVTITVAEAVGDRSWNSGDRVVVYDDDDPANVVFTTVSAATGSTITVADSCAAVTGTNKYITKNLAVDGGFESVGVANISVGANQTVTKDASVVKYDSQSLKDIFAAANDNDESTIFTSTLANGDDYWTRLWIFPSAIHDNSKLYWDIDGSATPILSREIGKSLDDRGNFARAFNLAGVYGSEAANSSIHNITTEDIGLWAWVKLATGSTGGIILRKDLSNVGYNLTVSSSGIIQGLIGTGTPEYRLSGNTDIRDGKWHFVAMIIDRNNAANCKIYLDGIEDGTTNKTGTLASHTGSLSNAVQLGFGKRFNETVFLDGFITEGGIAYPADIMAAGEMGAAGEIANLFNNPGDPSAWPNSEDYWLCNDNTGSTVVTGANNNLVAIPNTSVFAVTNWKMYEMTFRADQAAITEKLRITGAGAGANSATVYLDQGELREDMADNPGCEGGADPPASWVQETNATVVSDTSPHSGTNCLKATAGAANVGASQAITLVSGKYYTVIGWAKATSGDTAEITIDTGDTSTISVGTVTATSWTQIQATFLSTGPSGVIYLRGVVNGDIVWFDDLMIVQVDKADASIATRTRDFGNSRVEALEIWNRKHTVLEVKEISNNPNAMFEMDESIKAGE